ncbi:MAG: SpoIIE family protein phosphatase [Acidobacteriota bacterium]|nr:SpoIIE family protein phosphatase [Acidobacteriota bacterium]
MSRVALKHIVSPRGGGAAAIAAITGALGTSVRVEDADGRVLHGAGDAAGTARYPVLHGGEPVGWVSGAEGAQAVAELLAHLMSKDAERRALGTEVLHLYREVNLIYSFSEKLAALLDLDRVARLTLQEARHLIPATDGAVLLLDDDTGTLSTLAGFGQVLPALAGLRRAHGIIGSIVASGVAEIVNDVDADPRRVRDRSGLRSLLCAPLRVGERVIGAIALGSAASAAYTAAELKLLNTLALQTATAIENARLFERTIQAARDREALLAANKEMEVARAKLEREFELAATIQAQLFPAELPAIAGYDVAARNRPARQCGGDYYDALPYVDGRVLLCVADVSGKGVPAALLMSHTQATLRALLGGPRTLQALAAQASELLYASTAANKYVTAALLDLDIATGAARFVSDGHADCLLVRADGTAARLASTGAPLGLLPPGLPYDETAISIGAGDCLVLFSDGIADAQNETGEEFGDGRLLDLVIASRTQSASAMVDRVFNAIDAFAGSAPQFDDVTILVLRRTGA